MPGAAVGAAPARVAGVTVGVGTAEVDEHGDAAVCARPGNLVAGLFQHGRWAAGQPHAASARVVRVEVVPAEVDLQHVVLLVDGALSREVHGQQAGNADRFDRGPLLVVSEEGLACLLERYDRLENVPTCIEQLGGHFLAHQGPIDLLAYRLQGRRGNDQVGECGLKRGRNLACWESGGHPGISVEARLFLQVGEGRIQTRERGLGAHKLLARRDRGCILTGGRHDIDQ